MVTVVSNCNRWCFSCVPMNPKAEDRISELDEFGDGLKEVWLLQVHSMYLAGH